MWRRDEEKQADRKRSSRGRVGKEERERGGRAKENKEGKMSDRKERGDRSSRSSRGRNSRWVDENTFWLQNILLCPLLLYLETWMNFQWHLPTTTYTT